MAESALVTLASAISRHPVIYNNNLLGYRNPEARNRAWGAISKDLQTDVKTLKSKWKSMRDMYIKNKNNMAVGAPGAKKGESYLMDALKFLDNFMTISSARPVKYNSEYQDYGWQKNHTEADSDNEVDFKEEEIEEDTGPLLKHGVICIKNDQPKVHMEEPRAAPEKDEVIVVDEVIVDEVIVVDKEVSDVDLYNDNEYRLQDSELQDNVDDISDSTTLYKLIKRLLDERKSGSALQPACEEDTNFCLSLIGSLQRLDRASKARTKIAILQVLFTAEEDMKKQIQSM